MEVQQGTWLSSLLSIKPAPKSLAHDVPLAKRMQIKLPSSLSGTAREVDPLGV